MADGKKRGRVESVLLALCCMSIGRMENPATNMFLYWGPLRAVPIAYDLVLNPILVAQSIQDTANPDTHCDVDQQACCELDAGRIADEAGCVGEQPNRTLTADAYKNVGVCNWTKLHADHEAYEGESEVVQCHAVCSSLHLQATCEASGCFWEADRCSTCSTKKRYAGLYAASWNTAIVTVSEIVTAIFIPGFGALVDVSGDRKKYFIASTSIMLGVYLLRGFLAQWQGLWFYNTVLEIPCAMTWEASHIIVMAFYPELTDDDKEQMRIQSKGVAVMFWALLVYMALSVVFPGLFAMCGESGRLAALALSFCAYAFALMPLALLVFRLLVRNMPRREASLFHREAKTNQGFLAGFSHALYTMIGIGAKYPQARIYLVSVMIAQAALGSIASVVSVYLVVQLQMLPDKVTSVLGAAILCYIPGGLLLDVCSKRGMSSLTAVKISWCSGSIVFLLCGLVLQGPGQAKYAILFGVLFGLVSGFNLGATRSVYSTLVPAGQETEYMGIWDLANMLLRWSPPLMMTVFFEAFGSMFYGLLFCAAMNAIGFLILILLFNHEKALADVAPDTVNRQKLVDATPQVVVKANENPGAKE